MVILKKTTLLTHHVRRPLDAQFKMLLLNIYAELQFILIHTFTAVSFYSKIATKKYLICCIPKYKIFKKNYTNIYHFPSTFSLILSLFLFPEKNDTVPFFNKSFRREPFSFCGISMVNLWNAHLLYNCLFAR